MKTEIDNSGSKDGVSRKSREFNQAGDNQLVPTEKDFSDIICDYLAQIGVEYVFGIPGGSLEPFYNGLARSSREGTIKSVVARHESGAAFMADGYARETGKLGVCCATTGPGATNMLTGVASAYMDNIPLLVITAQTSQLNFGRGAVQDSSDNGVNTLAIYESCTRYNSLVTRKEQLERKLVTAILAAHQKPCGPVHLSIPIDIFRQSNGKGKPQYNLMSLLGGSDFLDTEKNLMLYEKLRSSSKTCFIIGDKVAECAGLVLELALMLNADVVATPQGRGFVSSDYANFKGVFGLAGHQTATQALNQQDLELVVAVGTSLDEQATNGWDETSLLNAKLVHVDDNPENFSRSLEAQLHVQGSLPGIFKFLINKFNRTDIPIDAATDTGYEHAQDHRKTNAKIELFPRSARFVESSIKQKLDSLPFKLSNEHKVLDDSVPLKPQRLMMDLPDLFPVNTRYLADIGNSFLWAIHYLQPRDRRIYGERKWTGGNLRTGMGFASMGWSIGASIGTAIANRKNPVVCICGDGSTLMSGQELTTAVSERLTIVFVILNDSSYGTVKHGQRLAGAEPIAYQLPTVSFSAIAKAMGAHGHEIRTTQDLRQLDMTAICNRAGPTVLDVYIDPEETPPFATRLKVLNSENSYFLTGHDAMNPAELF